MLVPLFLVYLKAILKGRNKQKHIVDHEQFIRSPKVYHQLLFFVDCHIFFSLNPFHGSKVVQPYHARTHSTSLCLNMGTHIAGESKSCGWSKLGEMVFTIQLGDYQQSVES